MAQALASAYDVIMVDARGHGLSEKPKQGYTNQAQAADLAGLIEALGIGPTRLLGHSMGARVAATMTYYRADLVNRLGLKIRLGETGRLMRAQPGLLASGLARTCRRQPLTYGRRDCCRRTERQPSLA